MLRSFPLAALVALASVLAGCGSDSDGSAGGPDTAAADATSPSTEPIAASTSTETTETTVLDAPAGQLTDQYGVRYCEVLTITVAETGTTAEVWGTQGLNDCPGDAFASIDPASVVADMGVNAAMPNGPRFWVLDDIVANELAGSGETRDFGGIEMRSIATVDLGQGIPDRTPYSEISVLRDTEFSYDSGREVYELTALDGSVYVMQSYSVEVDTTTTGDSLAGLGERLLLPEGWTFTSRVLDERLIVEDIDGVASVIQDELRNSYQLRSRPGQG